MTKKQKNYSVGPSVITAIFLVLIGVGAFVYFFVIEPSKNGLSPRATLPVIPGTGGSPAVSDGADRNDGVFSSER